MQDTTFSSKNRDEIRPILRF